MQSGDDEVVSEVFSGLRAAATAEGHWRFDFCPLCDQDGDLLPRRPEKRRRRPRVPSCHASSEDGAYSDDLATTAAQRREDAADRPAPFKLSVEVEALSKSSVALCGMQVWGGALLLADFIFTHMSFLENEVVVELGAGPGLLGPVLARSCRRVFLTDFADDVLQLCQRNVERNRVQERCRVRRLDWRQPQRASSGGHDDFGWQAGELDELSTCAVFFAADVIYSDELTDAFVSQVRQLLFQPCAAAARHVFVAVEQRWNFTLPECATTSREYDFFLSCLALDPAADSSRPGGRLVKGEKIPLDFGRSFPYDRTHMHLWRLSAA